MIDFSEMGLEIFPTTATILDSKRGEIIGLLGSLYAKGADAGKMEKALQAELERSIEADVDSIQSNLTAYSLACLALGDVYNDLPKACRWAVNDFLSAQQPTASKSRKTLFGRRGR